MSPRGSLQPNWQTPALTRLSKGNFAALHMSAYGTKPTWRDKSRMSAFGGKADKRRRVALTALVADDPERTSRDRLTSLV
jgi:hypothetical protein